MSQNQTVVNAVKLDPKTPIPLETNGNGYITKKGRKYVPFFDNGDNFFQILLEANLLSPTNLACVNSKTKFSIGNGWMLRDGNEDLKLKEWAKSVNKKGQSLNDILKGIFNNRYSCGNSFVEIVKVKVGNSKYIKVFLKNYIDCRLGEPDEDDICDTVLVSKTFRKKGIWHIGEKKDFPEIPIYTGEKNQSWYKDDQGNEHLIIHLKNEMSGYDYYGMPSNVACLPQQILEYKMSRYNLDNFDNNLVIGGLIVLQANMGPEESKKVAREITGAHTGDGKRGKYVILSSESGVENSKVINFDQNKEYDFINGSKRVEEQILLSNEWSKALIDPQAGGGLGNSGKQIRELYEVKMNTVIAPEQSFVIEKFLHPLMAICDEWMGTKWKDYEFGINQIPVLGISTDIDVNSVLSVNEGREALGYAELEGDAGNARIKETKQLNLNHVQN